MVTGRGPMTFERGHKALAEIRCRHSIAVHDPTAITMAWERVTKASTPRSASRAEASQTLWFLFAMSPAPPLYFTVAGGEGVDVDDVPDYLTHNGEMILRHGDEAITYVIGSMPVQVATG
jgi:hypothetical protein